MSPGAQAACEGRAGRQARHLPRVRGEVRGARASTAAAWRRMRARRRHRVGVFAARRQLLRGVDRSTRRVGLHSNANAAVGGAARGCDGPIACGESRTDRVVRTPGSRRAVWPGDDGSVSASGSKTAAWRSIAGCGAPGGPTGKRAARRWLRSRVALSPAGRRQRRRRKHRLPCQTCRTSGQWSPPRRWWAPPLTSNQHRRTFAALRSSAARITCESCRRFLALVALAMLMALVFVLAR